MIDFNAKTKKEKSSKEIFLDIKKKITKLYPEAKTQIDIFGKYYVVNKNGFKIIPEEYKIKNCDSVLKAWKTTLEFLSVNKILQVNNRRFSPYKISDSTMNKMLNQT